jgi:putative ABC transport system permease protein
LTALRILAGNRLYSLINIGGLALGLAACTLILMFVRDELSYDDWIPQAERIYKLELTIPIPGRDTLRIGQIPPAVAPAMERYFPDRIEDATRVLQEDAVVGGNDRWFSERLSFVDADFFNVFDLELVSGNRDAIAAGTTDILISESLARKFFGDADPLEQALTATLENPYGNINEPNIEFRVAGVFRDLPHNTHLPFQALALIDPVRFPGINEDFGGAWLEAGYVKLREGVEAAELESRFTGFYRDTAPPRGDESERYDYRIDRQFNLINVRDVYLHSDKIQQLKPISDISTVVSFSLAAALILLIATINFMNLTTARALRRAKEVSLRKVLGATRRQLIRQFLGEAVLTAFIALLAAVLLVEIALPWFNQYVGKAMKPDLLGDPLQFGGILLAATVAGVLGGLYPAFFLSSYRPAQVMASSTTANKGSPFIRKALVIFQFAISIGLIVATGIVHQQTRLLREMDLGFDQQQKLALTGMTQEKVRPMAGAIRQEMLGIPGVTAASFSSDELPLVFYNTVSIEIPGLGLSDPIDTDRLFVDAHFLELFGARPIAGRIFSEEFKADHLDRSQIPWTRNAVVTESFLHSTGLTEARSLIGKTLVLPDFGTDGEPLHATVVGVIQDMHFRALRERMAQMVFFSTDAVLDVMTLGVRADRLAETLAAVDATWRRLMPEVPIRRNLLDDQYEALYDAEQRRGEVFGVFAALAILLACLGLFGLAAYAVEQRRFEIGIRKVLGAGVTDILALTSFDFLKSVLWANLLAWPVVYLVMRNWLDGYEYRVDIDPLLFLACGGFALALAWLTVGWHALKAARSNPIHSLRYQ